VITWNVLRAAGIGAYLMLWGSVAWGLVSTTSLLGRRVPKATTVALHQALSTSGLLLLAIHLGFVLLDRYVPFSPLDLVVPMRSSYRPIGVTLGIAAMFVMILGVLGTSWGRKLIGTRWWRRMHSLSVPAFALALTHGLMTGTDSPRRVMFWLYVVTTAALLFLLVLRAFTVGQRPERGRSRDSAVRSNSKAQSSPPRSGASRPGSDPDPVPVPLDVGAGVVDRVESPAALGAGVSPARGDEIKGGTDTRIGRAGWVRSVPEMRSAPRTNATASTNPARPETRTRTRRRMIQP
jgi:methionine sulfoxide reductase heme-binding subunit